MKRPSGIDELVTVSRRLGCDRRLVLHGGGNTSLKTSRRDATGRQIDVLCVKGSGRDLSEVGPNDFPVLRMEPLLALAALDHLSDAEMVANLNAARLDSDAPTPSVETLLHAFVPAKYVLHTHANAVLALTNQPNGAKLCREVFGEGVHIAPYAMSGFALAKSAYGVTHQNPNAWALVILKHGIFTFGHTAKEAEARMRRAVRAADRYIKTHLVTAIQRAKLAAPAVEVLAPILRGALATRHGDGTWSRLIGTFRTNAAIRAYVDGRTLARTATAGLATPDHVIWTKPKPLILDNLPTNAPDKLRAMVRAAVERYAKDYGAYVARFAGRRAEIGSAVDPLPRVVLVPGLGLFGFGRTQREAAIASDLAEANAAVIMAAERIGRFAPVSEGDLFDIEYWGPEQAKRARAAGRTTPPLLGQVAVVTGGGSGIGAATAKIFAAAGAAVAVLDLDKAAAEKVAAPFGGLGLACDVTDRRAIARAIAAICARFGGLDIVISNAGAAWQGEIGTVDDTLLRKSFELNFFAHQSVAQAAVAIMRRQGNGGCLLFNTSKQAVNPGRDFGPYGLPKAATMFLVRQYALDHGKDGIRANAVNADRIRSGLLTDTMIAQRAKARGLSERSYMSGNLLGEEVTAEDVAQAFLHLALSPKTTAAVLTVDGGNIEAALR